MADPRVKYLWTKISENLNLPNATAVADWAVNVSSDEIAKINKFFTDQTKSALFFYVIDRSPLNMIASDDPTNFPADKAIIVIYFMKVEKEKNGITASNIDQMLACGVIYGDPILSFNNMYKHSYSKVVRTALNQAGGDVDMKQLNIIMSNIERKCQSIASVIEATEKSIKLDAGDMHGITLDSQSILQASHDDNMVNKFAQKMQEWCNQIQRLLSDTEQVRQEDEDSGPRAEMDYWRERLSIFSSLLESIRSDDVRAVATVLKIRRPPVITLWNQLDMQITESTNEAKDNVKFLSSLEKYTELLYALDPPECIELIPGLITSVSMVHNISRYYRSPQRICTLFKKVTNQMINASIRYIKQGGELHEQDRTKLIEKFKSCIALNDKYQSFYNNTMKTKVEVTPGEEVPEEQKKPKSSNGKGKKSQPETQRRELRTHFIIFGKYDAFSARCKSLIQLFTTIEEFNGLSECKIEGMDGIVKRFTEDIDFTKRSSYNMLDPRLNTFDDDFKLFQTNCTKLDNQLKQIIAESFQVMSTPLESLRLYERLSKSMTRQQGQAELEKWFMKALDKYSDDSLTKEQIG